MKNKIQVTKWLLSYTFNNTDKHILQLLYGLKGWWFISSDFQSLKDLDFEFDRNDETIT